MSRIIFGVHGTGHGHAIRALTVARHFSEHEFLFISHGTGAEILEKEFPVVRLPGVGTAIRYHRVALWSSIFNSLRTARQSGSVKTRILKLIDQFQPDVAMSDYEFFLPWVCRTIGMPCLSSDNQHVITCCDYPIPLSQRHNHLITYSLVNFIFNLASDFLLTSFFHPPLKTNHNIKLFPPLLRQTVINHQSYDGSHVVAYQGYLTFNNFFSFLRNIPHPVKVYGFDQDNQDGNLLFKKNSEIEFLKDLASCKYVICAGNHTLISEALFFGKPVLSFPIKNAFEQFLNAFYLARLGYGQYHTSFNPPQGIIRSFEDKLDHFRANIRQGNFCGNPEIFAFIDQFIRQKGLNQRSLPGAA